MQWKLIIFTAYSLHLFAVKAVGCGKLITFTAFSGFFTKNELSAHGIKPLTSCTSTTFYSLAYNCSYWTKGVDNILVWGMIEFSLQNIKSKCCFWLHWRPVSAQVSSWLKKVVNVCFGINLMFKRYWIDLFLAEILFNPAKIFQLT